MDPRIRTRTGLELGLYSTMSVFLTRACVNLEVFLSPQKKKVVGILVSHSFTFPHFS